MSRLALSVAGALVALSLGCNAKRSGRNSGPYVQQVTPSSAIVAMITEDPQALQVNGVGVESGAAFSTAEDQEVQIHGLQVSGLEPSTEYAYTIETASGVVLGRGTFHTAPATSDGACVFLVTGDSGGTDSDDGEAVGVAREVIDSARGADEDENRQGDVAGAMLARGADLVLHTGDVVYPAGAREDYPEGYFLPFAPLIANVPVYPTLGNHDVKTEGGQPYLEAFFLPQNGPGRDGRTYSFDWGPVHFVALDVVSTSSGSESEQAQWLERDLAASARPWTVVYFHVPPFSAYRDSNEVLQGDLVDVLERLGVDLVFSGHDHHYARFAPRGSTTYVVTGGGGKDLYRVRDAENLIYAESVFHFVEVRADPGSLVVRAIDLSGAVFDELTIRKQR